MYKVHQVLSEPVNSEECPTKFQVEVAYLHGNGMLYKTWLTGPTALEARAIGPGYVFYN